MSIVPKTFKINLNLKPEQRYQELKEYYGSELPNIKKSIDTIYKQFVGSISNSVIRIAINTFGTKNIMYYDELEYYAKLLDMPIHQIVALQLLYEACSGCTTIVTKCDNKYTMFRTMDWKMDFLKNITFQGEYYRDDRLLYTATSWLGCVGMFTISSVNDYAMAINYRRTQDISYFSIIKNIYNIYKMFWPISYLLRHICENMMSYADAKHLLNTAFIVSPAYVTLMSSKHRPRVYARGNLGLTSRVYKSDYTVQTNCDIGKTEPNILWSVERRDMCETSIRKSKNNFSSIEEMKMTFIKSPVINFETIYLNVIQPNELYQIYIINNS